MDAQNVTVRRKKLKPEATEISRVGRDEMTLAEFPSGIFASLAEFERDLISERTKAGLASARARGRKGGAPFKMTAAKVRLAMAAMGQKETKVADLCSELGVPRQTLYRHVAPNGTLRKDGSRVVEGGKNRKPQGKKP
jgi:DNA invertase Pin-like site-specific DNA recombinase